MKAIVTIVDDHNRLIAANRIYEPSDKFVIDTDTPDTKKEKYVFRFEVDHIVTKESLANALKTEINAVYGQKRLIFSHPIVGGDDK